MEKKLNPLEKVYYIFYSSKKQRMYFNEIREKAKISISSLQNSLRKLEKSGEIEKTKERANVFYNLNDEEAIALNFSKFDILRLESLNINVKLPIKELIEKAGNIAFVLLFGSASRGEEKKGSDIDLIIVTHHFVENRLNEAYQKQIKEEIGEISKTVKAKSLYTLSLVFIDEKEFETRKDYLLDEAKKTGFCVYNQQYYHKRK